MHQSEIEADIRELQEGAGYEPEPPTDVNEPGNSVDALIDYKNALEDTLRGVLGTVPPEGWHIEVVCDDDPDGHLTYKWHGGRTVNISIGRHEQDDDVFTMGATCPNFQQMVDSVTEHIKREV